MKKWVSILLLLLPSLVFSQPVKKTNTRPASTTGQPEMNKMMEDALDKLPSDQRAMAEQMMKDQLNTLRKTNNTNFIPQKNFGLLQKLPTIHDQKQYLQLLQKLKSQAQKSIPALIINNTRQLQDKYKQEINTLNNITILLFMQGQTEASVYAAICTALDHPAVELIQNNLAFVLHQIGYPQYAIPILEYLLSLKADAVMYSNAGQCYYSLGDTARAHFYFNAALKLNDNIAEAHCGTALILIAQKKEAEAVEHIEKTFRDGYSALLDEVVTSRNIRIHADKMMKPVKQYFNPDDYEPLGPVRDRTTLIEKYEKTDQLKSTLSAWERQRELTADSFKTGNRTWEYDKVTGVFKKPFQKKAWLMGHILNNDFMDYFKEITSDIQNLGAKIEKEYYKMEQGIAEQISTGKFNSDYELCKMKEKYLEAYLSATVYPARELKSLMSEKIIENVNQQLYWQSYLLTDGEFRHQYFNMGTSILSSQIGLSSLQRMSPLPIDIATSCDKSLSNPPDPDDIEGKNRECTYSIKIPVGPGSMKFTCDGWEIEAGEGIVVNFIKKNNKKNDFTIAFGPGINESVLTAEAGGKAQFYISCNDDGPTDMGFRGEIKTEVNAIVRQYETGYAGQIGISGIKLEVMDGSGNEPAPIFKYDPTK